MLHFCNGLIAPYKGPCAGELAPLVRGGVAPLVREALCGALCGTTSPESLDHTQIMVDFGPNCIAKLYRC